MVTDDQCMCAQLRAAGISLMGEPVIQTFFAHQPVDEVEVGFAVLSGERALGVNTGVCQVKFPGGGVGALACAVFEHGVENVDDAHVLVDSAVAAVAQQA